MAKRARIVLLAAEGTTNRDIAELVDMHYNQVGLWRARSRGYGLAASTTASAQGGRRCMTMTPCC